MLHGGLEHLGLCYQKCYMGILGHLLGFGICGTLFLRVYMYICKYICIYKYIFGGAGASAGFHEHRRHATIGSEPFRGREGEARK